MALAGSKNLSMHGTFMRENREIPFSPVVQDRGCGPLGEGQGRKPEMYEGGQSHSPVVPAKPPNKVVAAEAVEERGLASRRRDKPARNKEWRSPTSKE